MNTLSPPAPLPVIWHDLECHGYAADLPLWHELAAGRVLEIGAGTGRVSLDLAAAGLDVTALEADPVLLDALRDRARRRGLAVEAICADAQALDLGDVRFGAIFVPMQTIQLFADRSAFLAAARRHLEPAGVLAAALVEELAAFEGTDLGAMPDPDAGQLEGWRFQSQPMAIRVRGDRAEMYRLRVATAPDGTMLNETDTTVLAMMGAERLEADGRAAGFRVERRRAVPATADHVGSAVVVLRA